MQYFTFVLTLCFVASATAKGTDNGTNPDDRQGNTDCATSIGLDGIFQSQNYPGDYNDNEFDCVLVNAPDGSTVNAIFDDYQLEGQCFDAIDFYDGPSLTSPQINEVCSDTYSTTPPTISSTGNQMLIVFNSDCSNSVLSPVPSNDPNNGMTFRGFKIHFA